MTIFCIAALVVVGHAQPAVAHWHCRRTPGLESEMAVPGKSAWAGSTTSGGGDHVMRKMTGLADSPVEKGQSRRSGAASRSS